MMVNTKPRGSHTRSFYAQKRIEKEHGLTNTLRQFVACRDTCNALCLSFTFDYSMILQYFDSFDM